MAFVDNQNQGDSQQQVAGSTPLSSGQSTDQPQEGGNSSVSGSSGSAIESSQSTPQQAQAVNKGSGKASSGQYSNIQKYVAKNKPQAQKITQAVTQDIGKQANAIKGAADQKKAQQDNLIKANEQAMTQARGQAKSTVDQITGNQTANTQPFEAVSADQFQKLMQGDIGQQQVNDLNIAKQQSRANALQQLSGRANTEQGRRDLLGQTFKKQGDYTRGISGLDQLITSGDKTAREQLIKGTQGVTDQLGNQLQGLVSDADIQRRTQQEALSKIGGQIGDIASGASTNIDTNIQNAYEKALSDRRALLDPNSAEYKAALAGADTRLADMQSGLTNYGDTIGSLIPGAYNKAVSNYGIGSYRDAASTGLENYANNVKEFENTGEITIPDRQTDYWGKPIGDGIKKISGKEAQNYLNNVSGASISHFKNRSAVRGLLDGLNQKFASDPNNLFGLKSIQSDFGESNSGFANTLGGSKNFFQKQLSGLGSASDVVQRKLAEVGKTDFNSLASGADIGKYEVADRGQIDKINALKQLMGRQDTITDQQIGDGQYADLSSLQNLLKQYRG